MRQLRAGLSVRQVSSFSAKHASSAFAKVGTRARRGSPPAHATARLSAAVLRASASGDGFGAPKPEVAARGW